MTFGFVFGAITPVLVAMPLVFAGAITLAGRVRRVTVAVFTAAVVVVFDAAEFACACFAMWRRRRTSPSESSSAAAISGTVRPRRAAALMRAAVLGAGM